MHALHFDVHLINTDVYAWTNLSGNYVIMVGSAIIFTLLLVLIESGVFRPLSKLSLCKVKDIADRTEDDDVVEEK